MSLIFYCQYSPRRRIYIKVIGVRIMVFEKKLIIMTGDGGAKGTLKIERNAYGLSAVITAYNVMPVTYEGFVLCVTGEGEEKLYELGVKLISGTEIALDENIDLKSAHFTVYEKGGSARLYGTLNPKRLWKGNLPDGRTFNKHDEKTIEKNEVIEKSAETFEFTKREELFSDIFPSGGGYSDNAVASVNYFETAAVNDVGARESAAASDEEPLYNEQGIRMEFIDDGERDRSIRSLNKESTMSISDLTYEFVRGRSAATDRTVKPVERTERKTFTGAKTLGERLGKFDSGAEKLVPTEHSGENEEIRGRKLSYYEQVGDQIEKLFSEGVREEKLEKLMPMTKWVKVDFSGDGRAYVVGLIGDRPDFICYGLPAKFSSDPPEELGDGCSWLPLDVLDPHGSGYWLLYQDADTGETVNKSV